MSNSESSVEYLVSTRESFEVSLIGHSCEDDEEHLDYDEVIAKLKTHSEQIREAHKAVENSHSALEKRVVEVSIF